MAGGRLSPLIPVGIYVGQQWRMASFYVDSGAFYSLMHARFAAALGMDFTSGRKIFAQVGDGSLIPVYLHQLPLQIGSTQFQAPVGFSERLGVAFNLLGRIGVFERFQICFHERQRAVSFLPVA